MPNFHIVPLDETTRRTGPRRRSRITREYLGYIDQLEPGKAGRVHPAKGETIEAVRRRLGKVVKLTDKSVKIKRVGEEIYFSGSSPKRNGSDATKVRQQGPDPVYRASKLVPGDGVRVVVVKGKCQGLALSDYVSSLTLGHVASGGGRSERTQWCFRHDGPRLPGIRKMLESREAGVESTDCLTVRKTSRPDTVSHFSEPLSKAISLAYRRPSDTSAQLPCSLHHRLDQFSITSLNVKSSYQIIGDDCLPRVGAGGWRSHSGVCSGAGDIG
jgi:hypothetical protein